jgi:hypothetical protein
VAGPVKRSLHRSSVWELYQRSLEIFRVRDSTIWQVKNQLICFVHDLFKLFVLTNFSLDNFFESHYPMEDGRGRVESNFVRVLKFSIRISLPTESVISPSDVGRSSECSSECSGF